VLRIKFSGGRQFSSPKSPTSCSCKTLGARQKKNDTMNNTVLKNPITISVKASVDSSSNCINIAVPFISSFVRTILNQENTKSINDKKIITRFDDSFINSFDLPSLKTLLSLGFTLKFDNNIHLKLYITDNEAYVTSSNLTKGGFEDNIELTVKIEKENTDSCKIIFNEIWDNCGDNFITNELIEANQGKYELLKKRDTYARKNSKPIKTQEIPVLNIDIQKVIDTIFNQNKDYTNTLRLEFEANKLREETKRKLKKSFNTEIFYVPEGHHLRKLTLFYDFVYGYESQLAGTGLRESHFQSVFQHPDFEKVINYIFPEMIGMKPWNFQDENILKEFCNGIFDFDIPSYKESMPIRLATYFYPNILLPIFKLDHLKEICDAFGFETDAETNGDKLFIFNSFLTAKMKILPFENIIKGYVAYQVRFTINLLNRLNNNESYEAVLASTNKVWIKDFYEEGKNILIKLNKTK
jgi:hypothetical protein